MILRAQNGLNMRSLTLTLSFALLMAGCPTQQQPRPDDDTQEPSSSASIAAPASDSSAIDRPLQPPGGASGPPASSSGGPPSSGGSGSGGSASGGSPGSVVLSATGPLADTRVRAGTPVTIEYALTDTQNQVISAALILARDANADGLPDGDPVWSQSIQPRVPLGNGVIFTTDPQLLQLLSNGFGRFRVGVRLTQRDGTVKTAYAPGELLLDAQAPAAQWLAPLDDAMTNRRAWPVQIQLADNEAHSIRVVLDRDTIPLNNTEFDFVPLTAFATAGSRTLNFANELPSTPSGIYYFCMIAADAVAPPVVQYAKRANGEFIKVLITRRIVGEIPVASLDGTTGGAILQGFNFNDLGGSSIRNVPDLNGDGLDELLVGSRFGKAHIIQHNGVGFGEGYLFYGSAARLRGTTPLNAAGGPLPGLIFPGIRTPRSATIAPPNESTRWTAGMSDITVIPDMDGDNLPELAFSFPRVESISLRTTESTIQHPELVPDLAGMGELEFDAYDPQQMAWIPNRAQFTRGGVVIVSSHSELLRSATRLNRKSDRIIDLQEVGQIFDNLSNTFRPRPVPYIRAAVRRDALPPPRTGPFRVCVDCDGELPEGCEDSSPPSCGDDGCILNNSSASDGREQPLQRWVVQWDVTFPNQGPGGFFSEWSPIPADPPLANGIPFPFVPNALNPNDRFPFPWYPNRWIGSPDPNDPCNNGTLCEITNEWFVWASSCNGTSDAPSWSGGGQPRQDPLPDCYPDNPCPNNVLPPQGPCAVPDPNCMNPPVTVDASGTTIWTGFYGPCVQAIINTATGEQFDSPIGARILGQKVEDRFGSTIDSDGTWLYMCAPNRSPNDAPYLTDVPSLSTPRPNAGVVYQLRTFAPSAGGVTRTQLWIEPQPSERPAPACLGIGTASIRPWWPYVDSEDGFRIDYTMPVPHQYMIESIGSLRGNPALGVRDLAFGDPSQPDACPPPYDPGFDAPDLDACSGFSYPVGTAGYYMDRTPEIIGPHADAHIELVRALGDGIRDFAVGSGRVRSNVLAGSGPAVGALFIVFGRPTGLEGDYLLEQLALNTSDPARLNGVLVKGSVAGASLGRAIADAGDVNGDGLPDVLLGHDAANGNSGEAILLFGSTSLLSPGPDDLDGTPGGGWTFDSIPSTRAIRFRGAAPGDLAGATVAAAGDVDADGFDDILIGAPGAAGGRGEVYLIYGSNQLPPVTSIAALTPANFSVPFARFVGRNPGDALGGGAKTVIGTDPAGGSTTAYGQGLARLGDLDGDNATDFALSAMLADPGGKVDAGEVYVIYGRRGP